MILCYAYIRYRSRTTTTTTTTTTTRSENIPLERRGGGVDEEMGYNSDVLLYPEATSTNKMLHDPPSSSSELEGACATPNIKHNAQIHDAPEEPKIEHKAEIDHTTKESCNPS